tara:strand:+ start:998 stop:1789 length:792 start_codon:yes stop_codon:yes gene_type:complete
MPAEHNGYLDADTRSIEAIGSLTWDTTTPGNSLSWDEWTQWVTYTGSAYLGAPGFPLRYQTEIIDLGASVSGYFEVRYNATGTIRVVIETSDNSDMSGATFQAQYTNDNTATGTVQTHTQLNYYEEGYCDQTYGGFTARYVRLTAYVELFDSLTQRGIPKLGKFNWEVLTDTVVERLNDVSVSGDAHTLTFSTIGTLVNLHITPTDQTNKKLVPAIVSKTNKTIRVLDANAFNVSGVSATVDVTAEGMPGNYTVNSEGILREV